MKALKIIIAFVLILAGVFSAFYFSTRVGEGSIAPPQDERFEDTRKQIQNEWEQRGDWDDTLYTKNLDLVTQLGVEFNTVPLKELNTSLAVEIVYKKIFDEWKSPTCQRAVVNKYYNAVSFIKSKDSDANTDNNVKLITQVYSVYNQAYNLAHQSIGLSPNFNGTSWNSYSDYRESMLNKRNNMLNNSVYKSHLSNIKDIKEGLNDIPNKLANGRSEFYNKLAQNIKNYFSRTAWSDRNYDELAKLRNAKNKYEDEYGYSSVLSNFEDEYASDVFFNND